ncbi:MAG: HdeD family acid-resistance protein [Anaerolineae bacterium]
MLYAMSRDWWAWAVRGVVAVLFGVATFIWPSISLAVLVALFGAYALVDGILTTAVAVSNTNMPRWWVLLVEGLVGIGAGIVAFLYPSITALALLMLIAAWAIVTGILEVVAAIQLRKELEGEWLLALSGVLSVVFGVLLVLQPTAGALAVLWLIGAYAIVFGVTELVLAIRLRRIKNLVERPMASAS